MSTETGVWHSLAPEWRDSWIVPEVRNYGDFKFASRDGIGQWLPIAASESNGRTDLDAPGHEHLRIGSPRGRIDRIH
jgi:hypothetical protein